MKMSFITLIFLMATLILVSCEAPLKVTSDYDKAVNFSQYKTFTINKVTEATKQTVSPLNQDRILNAEIDLPGGKVKMKLIGRRYEKVGIHISTERFLVGAQIQELTGTDKEMYETFLKAGPRRAKGSTGALELGID